MLQRQQIYSLFIFFFVFGRVFAHPGGVIGALSPRLMYDGRPVLWQNLDSDSASTYVRFFQGERYNFFGVLNGDDSTRVYAGLNTAGFAIVYSALNSETTNVSDEPVLIKQALERCGRLEDFERLVSQTDLEIGSNSSFACMDAFGELKLYESGREVREPDFVTSPDGFLVRANFHFMDPQQADEGFWRYHRAKEIIRLESSKRKLHHHVIVKDVSRDLESIADKPYPLPFEHAREAPSGYLTCKNSINQFNTVSSVVFHGVRAGENPDFATMWISLGEPMCSMPVPLWPATSQVPLECQNSEFSLGELFQQLKGTVYDLENAELANTRTFVTIRAQLDPLENIVFAETRKALSRWREKKNYLQDMIEFQMNTAAHVYDSISK